MSSTIILAAGLFPRSKRVLQLLHQANFVACCDGAANTCLQLGITPQVIVGDADSLCPEVVAQWSDRLVRIPEQETNDLTKTLRHCLSLGHRDITILGATGLREDHALGNISLLMDYADWLPVAMGRPPSIRMVSDYGTFYPCRDKIALSVEMGCEVSIFNFGATHFTANGLQYPLYDFDRLWQGTLNVATQPTITIEAKGKFLVYVAESDTKA